MASPVGFGAMPPPRALNQTLPLRWVVAAIVVFIVAYTFLRLHFSKHGRPFEPYHDIGERVAARRLVERGYERVSVEIERPAEILPESRFSPATDDIGSALGGLPPELEGALAPKPALPDQITGVSAPREIATGATYALQFICAQPDYRTQVESVILVRKGTQVFLLPDFPRLSGQLLARSKETVILAHIPTQDFSPGEYTVTLCGRQSSKTWQFTIR
jgi:hypothetical protein